MTFRKGEVSACPAHQGRAQFPTLRAHPMLYGTFRHSTDASRASSLGCSTGVHVPVGQRLGQELEHTHTDGSDQQGHSHTSETQ